MRGKTKIWIHKNIWYILAFIIPFVAAVTAFICQGMGLLVTGEFPLLTPIISMCLSFRSCSINGATSTACFIAGTAALE